MDNKKEKLYEKMFENVYLILTIQIKNKTILQWKAIGIWGCIFHSTKEANFL